MLIQYHSSCPASWSAVRDFWIKSIIISLSLSCQNLSLVKILIQKIKVPGKVKIFFGIISLSLSCQNLFLVKILKIKVRWKSSFWKEEYVQTFSVKMQLFWKTLKIKVKRGNFPILNRLYIKQWNFFSSAVELIYLNLTFVFKMLL